ncbi:hypothetical protein M0811_13121 [Anaeramoeba ignava]|uniref:Ankyrin repeat protein n=1 Tax=Anaeramoeba ignava TaxID=1746090 RepID=A0A9Q0L6L3_ANAIG|nr:hypothetical protein M0811_13121 [Anaeramoeba ignava]|eukprot:Anaeramoba_ignava/a220929_61.p1 GENE.a220929_61~~a220929_61.p1  ORF type:complete len:269 (+),score=72.96 a220929_61:26-808(+)
MNISDTFQETPLIHCVKEKHLQNVELVLRKGAKVNSTDSSGMTALMHAALLGTEEIAVKLIENGADAAIKDKKEMTAIMYAGCHGKKKLVTLLQKYDKQTSQSQIEGSLLIYYSKKGNLKAVIDAIEKGANVNSTDEKKWSPLISASHYGRLEVVQELLKQSDIDINAQAMMNTTALHHATRQCHPEIVHELISHGADINHQDRFGYTPLFYIQDEETAHTFVRFHEKINFDLKNPNNLTAIEFHKKEKRLKIAEILEQK